MPITADARLDALATGAVRSVPPAVEPAARTVELVHPMADHEARRGELRPAVATVAATRPPADDRIGAWASVRAQRPADGLVVREVLHPGPRPATSGLFGLPMPLADGPADEARSALAQVLAHGPGAVAARPSSPAAGRRSTRQPEHTRSDTAASVDVDALADAVQAKLLRRSVIERERRGALR
jgi:hypothetical protein